MDRERLEKIKEHFAYCMDNGLLFAEQEEKLLEELYEQAKRVEELEELNLSTEWRFELQRNISRHLSEQNKCYKQALEDILGLDIDISRLDYADSVITISANALKGESE